MAIWNKLFKKSQSTETVAPLENAFPLSNPAGLSDAEIDSVIEDSSVETDEAIDSPASDLNDELEGGAHSESNNAEMPIAEPSSTSVNMDSEDLSQEVDTEAVSVEKKSEQQIVNSSALNTGKFAGKPIPQLGATNSAEVKQFDSELAIEEQEKSEESELEDSTNPSPSTHNHLEDLNYVDGQILPELQVPDWRQELEFAKDRYEPCDLSNHLVKVSKRRFVAKRIDLELAKSRRNAYGRFLDRASRRFKEKIDEDALLNEALKDLSEWKSKQSFSVSWKLAERINEELLKAKQAELDAVAFVQNNTEFTNVEAVEQYRYFVRRTLLIPVVTLYLLSVIGLTYNRFEWLLKFFPPFNLGLSSALIMVSGVAAAFWLSNLWKFSKKVSRVSKKAAEFEKTYKEQEKKIAHAVSEHVRLSQQQPMVEPIVQVLAKAYRVQLQSDTSVKAHATTFFDPASLPACVTLARAEDNDELKMAKLKRRALSVLMKPGWRTEGLDRIARIHADSQMLDSNSLSLKSLDTDSLVSATSAQKVLLDAFSNREIHGRVSRERLREAIRNLHKEVLANWESSDRPTVVSLREDGFNRLSFRSSWLDEQEVREDWIEFLSEILSEETSTFSIFNVQDGTSELNNGDAISSVAVVPHYFEVQNSKIKIEPSPVSDVLPMDVVVRVDVSPWADPAAFAVFADSLPHPISPNETTSEGVDEIDGDTSV